MGRFFAAVVQLTIAFLIVEVVVRTVELTVDSVIGVAPEAVAPAAVASTASKSKRKKGSTTKPRKTTARKKT